MQISPVQAPGGGSNQRIDGVTESGARLNISSRELTLMLKLTATVIKPTVGKLNIILFLEIL